MQIGLIGWQAGGKSTLFTSLTGLEPAYGEEAFPGMAEIPDDTLDRLHELWPMAKKVPAKVQYLDVAGVAHEEQRSGFKRSMINHLQNANVLCPVFGAYQETGSTEDVAEMMRALIEDFETELLLSDLQVAESRAEKIASSKQRGIKVDAAEDRAITKVLDALNEETPLRLIELGMEEEKAIRSYAFLTLKPLLIVINKGEEQDSNALQQALSDFEGDQKKLIVLDAQMEAEIAGLPEEDRGEFLEEMGIESPASERLLQESFNLLGLIRFFTVGEDEVRSWPIRKGTPAVEAAGEIHSDLQRGFIRAEVVHSTDLLELGSMSACRDKGVLRLEGKTYEVRDGDVMHVRFAV